MQLIKGMSQENWWRRGGVEDNQKMSWPFLTLITMLLLKEMMHDFEGEGLQDMALCIYNPKQLVREGPRVFNAYSTVTEYRKVKRMGMVGRGDASMRGLSFLILLARPLIKGILHDFGRWRA